MSKPAFAGGWVALSDQGGVASDDDELSVVALE